MNITHEIQMMVLITMCWLGFLLCFYMGFKQGVKHTNTAFNERNQRIKHIEQLLENYKQEQTDSDVTVIPSYNGRLSVTNEVHRLFLVISSIVAIDRQLLFNLYEELVRKQENRAKIDQLFKMITHQNNQTVSALSNPSVH